MTTWKKKKVENDNQLERITKRKKNNWEKIVKRIKKIQEEMIKRRNNKNKQKEEVI